MHEGKYYSPMLIQARLQYNLSKYNSASNFIIVPLLTTMWQRSQVVLNNREGRRLESMYILQGQPKIHAIRASTKDHARPPFTRLRRVFRGHLSGCTSSRVMPTPESTTGDPHTLPSSTNPNSCLSYSSPKRGGDPSNHYYHQVTSAS